MPGRQKEEYGNQFDYRSSWLFPCVGERVATAQEWALETLVEAYSKPNIKSPGLRAYVTSLQCTVDSVLMYIQWSPPPPIPGSWAKF